MKALLIFSLTFVAAGLVSEHPSTAAPHAGTQALRTCFGKPFHITIGNSLIYCDQAGTLFQDANDLDTHGFVKTQLLSANF